MEAFSDLNDRKLHFQQTEASDGLAKIESNQVMLFTPAEQSLIIYLISELSHRKVGLKVGARARLRVQIFLKFFTWGAGNLNVNSTFYIKVLHMCKITGP